VHTSNAGNTQPYPPHSARQDPAQWPVSDSACGRPWQAGQEMERLE